MLFSDSNNQRTFRFPQEPCNLLAHSSLHCCQLDATSKSEHKSKEEKHPLRGPRTTKFTNSLVFFLFVCSSLSRIPRAEAEAPFVSPALGWQHTALCATTCRIHLLQKRRNFLCYSCEPEVTIWLKKTGDPRQQICEIYSLTFTKNHSKLTE